MDKIEVEKTEGMKKQKGKLSSTEREGMKEKRGSGKRGAMYKHLLPNCTDNIRE